MSHLAKITLILLTGSLLALVLLLSYLTHTLQSSAIKQWIDYKQTSSARLANWIDDELDKALSDLKFTAQLPEFRAPPDAALIDLNLNGIPLDVDPERRRALDWLRSINRHFSVLFVLLPNGDHYISHPFPIQISLQRYNLSSRPYFIEVTRTLKPAISDSFVGADGVPAVAIDVPVINETGEITSHVGGVFHLSRLSSMFDESPYKTSNEVTFLLDRTGKVITYSNRAKAEIDKMSSQPFIRQFIERKRPTTDVMGYSIATQQLPAANIRDEQIVMLVRLKSGWTLGVSSDLATIVEQFKPGIWRNVILAALLMILLSTAGILAVHRIGLRWQHAESKVKAARDTLELKVSERTRELGDKERRLRLLIETIPDQVWMKDSNGRYLSCNRKFEAFSGATEQEIIGKTDLELTHRQNAEQIQRNDLHVVHTGLSTTHEEWITYADSGRIECRETILTPVFDTDGTVIGVLGIGRDITERKKTESSLRESEAFRQRVFESSSVPIVVMDSDSHEFIDCNPAAVTIYGFESREQTLGKTPLEVSTPTQYDGTISETAANVHINKALSGATEVFEWRHQRPNGEIWDAEVHLISFVSGDRHLLQFILHDITDQKRAAEQIRTLSQAIEQSPASVMITDTEGNIEYVNSTFERITGYLLEEVVGNKPSILRSDTTPPSRYREMWQAISAGKPWRGEFQNIKKDGEMFWESAHIAPVFNDSGEIIHYLAVKEDITLSKQQEQRILHQAHFDALTDLPNRFLSLDRLTQLINEAQRQKDKIAVLFVDLDDFKKINDSLGHDVGDKLLMQAAARLRDSIRKGDTIGRLGGDEFIILLGGLHEAAEARPIIAGLLEEFREPFSVDNQELIITASIGVAVFPNDGDNPSELLRNADSAMYHSKEQGRNTFAFFTDAMNLEVSRQLALEQQLHGALNRGEFHIQYQPLVNVANRTIIGAEALLRWKNPALGEISPEEFIPIAERTGLIVPIGRFVTGEALSQVRKWRNRQTDFKIAINYSPRQFRDPELVQFISRSMQQAEIGENTLEIEITEGVLMSGHAYIDNTLEALSKMEIAIAMDDFGTGYSSLSYLRRYPFNILKIDRSFINDITSDPADRELIGATIAMAHSLGLRVIAEGVETEEQFKFLHSLNCDHAQGHLFSPPVSAAEITLMLTPRRPITNSR
jgi:diguanylate cyclase (GGDEF)-like protein/PAS domain S-box-containing protein